MFEPLIECKFPKITQPPEDDPKLTIFGFMNNIYTNFENDIYCIQTTERLKTALEENLKERLIYHQICATDEELNAMIKAMINEFFCVRLQENTLDSLLAFFATKFMKISFATLKNIMQPPIKNLKVEIKIEPS